MMYIFQNLLLLECTEFTSRNLCGKVLSFSLQQFVSKMSNAVKSDVGSSGSGRNKLKTFKTFKHDLMFE